MMSPILNEPLLKKHDPYSERFEYLEELIQGQGNILEMIAKGEDLKVILNEIVLWAEKESKEGLLASILLLDNNSKQLLHGAAPSLPVDYNSAIHGITIGASVGSCGTAAYTKKQVIVEDIQKDPLWKDFKHIAAKFGLRACWSSPLITKNGEVLGTFAMYYKEPKKPSVHDQRVIKLIASTTVLAIEWTRTEHEKKLLLENERIAHQKAKEEWRSFYNLLMNAPAMVAILKGPDHVFELANPLYMEAVGSHRRILGKPIREALPELEGQGIFELLDEVYQKEEVLYGNELNIKIDREGNAQLEDAYFNFTYQPIKNEKGVEGIFVHAVNVTEIVNARKRIEESEKQFKSFVLNSPMPIGIYIGREMRIQTANDAILKAWEKDRSVIGKTFREALPELQGQPFYDILDNVFTSGIPYVGIENRVDLYRNGKITPTYWNFTYKPLKNENDEIYGVINTAAEVTDLVNAKKQLLNIEETLRTAIQIADLGTWQIDLSSNFVTYSNITANWFGLPRTGAPLDVVLSRINEADQKKVAEAVQNAIYTKGIYEAEYRVINPTENRERIVHAKGKVITDEGGRQIIMNGICRDITLQKETEKELEKQVEIRTQQLQKANDELNILNDNLKQFVYVASHDLQEPLRKINMFSDILKNKSSSAFDTQQEFYLSKISSAAKRMTNLIKDLLDFSRAEANDRSFTQVNLQQVVKNVIEDYEILIQQKQAKITINSLPEIEAIPLQMNQLFYNLIGNALKFTRNDAPSEINISSRLLSPAEVQQYERLEKHLKYTEIIVRDNGIGFDQQFDEQIFVIFQRLHRRDEYEGTGIGLALCKKIADNHSGLIFAKGEKRKGSAFHVILPVKNLSYPKL